MVTISHQPDISTKNISIHKFICFFLTKTLHDIIFCHAALQVWLPQPLHWQLPTPLLRKWVIAHLHLLWTALYFCKLSSTVFFSVMKSPCLLYLSIWESHSMLHSCHLLDTLFNLSTVQCGATTFIWIASLEILFAFCWLVLNITLIFSRNYLE